MKRNTPKSLLPMLLLAVALPAAAFKPLPKEYDSAAKIEKGFKALLKDETARKNYCRSNAIDAEALAAYKADDRTKVTRLNLEQKKLREKLPMAEAYTGISMMNASKSEFFTSPEAVAMNKAVSEVIASCRPAKP